MPHLTSMGRYYNGLGDEALLEAHSLGPESYEPDAWKVICAEVRSRRLEPSTTDGEVEGSRAMPQSTLSSTSRIGRSGSPVQSELTLPEIEGALLLLHRGSQRAVLWLLGGIAVTVGTWATAARGGTFVVAWGAIVYGLVRLVSLTARTKELERMRERIQLRPHRT